MLRCRTSKDGYSGASQANSARASPARLANVVGARGMEREERRTPGRCLASARRALTSVRYPKQIAPNQTPASPAQRDGLKKTPGGGVESRTRNVKGTEGTRRNEPARKRRRTAKGDAEGRPGGPGSLTVIAGRGPQARIERWV